MLKATRALLSVYDKRGVVDLGRGLDSLGIELLSTGGTYANLKEHGIPVRKVSEVTDFPEILDGRVKTLHPRIHGGILADRERAKHAGELREHGITPIDVVVVNLYPFRETVASGAAYEEVIDMIDIGGPTMIRAAAKNHNGVLVVVDPSDYPQILAALEQGSGQVNEGLRRRLALKAFRHTQAYDAAISEWLGRQSGDPDEQLHRHLLLDLERDRELRYGENPQQAAAVYHTAGGNGLFGGFEQLQGKELSYNNLLDADAARRLVARFDDPAVTIVKHNNPCGVGRGGSAREAFERAWATDRTSAFGSIVASNVEVTADMAEAMSELFVEVVIAPSFEDGAVTQFASKKNLRVLTAPRFAGSRDVILRAVDGGFLAQTTDTDSVTVSEWRCPTKRQPTETELRGMEFAWHVVSEVRSNAIVITNENQTIGIGAGQMSRVDSCNIAIAKAELEIADSIAASDAFFPFRDGLDVLAAAGVTAIVQPGGSKRDDELVAAADEHGVAMMMTGQRHFRH